MVQVADLLVLEAIDAGCFNFWKSRLDFRLTFTE
jgi:hypothetical protein